MTTTDTTPRLTFGCRHLPFDPERHKAAWGARLLYDEVFAGGKGLVYDRQSCIGESDDIKSIHPSIDEWVNEFRKKKVPASSQEIFTIATPEIVVMGSPQGSFGYIYVTGVLLLGAR